MLIALKFKLALACAAGLAGPLAITPLLTDAGSVDATLRDRPAIVELQSGTVSYRVAGDFTRAARQAEAPVESVRFTRPLAIMKRQVSAADYQHCVDEAGCRALSLGVKPSADRPAVQISWHDADAYAAWLSRKTGEHYRLPTDEEWEEFLGHFARRKVALGDCGRAYGTSCIHEHSCLTEMILMTAPGRMGSQCSPKVTGKNLGLPGSSAWRRRPRCLFSRGWCGIARRSCGAGRDFRRGR